MSSAEQHRQRVIVMSPFGQHQVDLPVDVPASGLLPDLLAVAGLHPSQVQVGVEGWRLEDAGGNAVLPGQTLAEHGIVPGDVIQLRGLQQPWSGAPAVAAPAVAAPAVGAPAPAGAGSDGGGPGAGVPGGSVPWGSGRGASSVGGTSIGGSSVGGGSVGGSSVGGGSVGGAKVGATRVGGNAVGASGADRGGSDGGQGKELLSRRVPRIPASSSPPDDSLSPLQRTQAALPVRIGRPQRMIAAVGAYFQGPDSPLLAGVAPDRLQALASAADAPAGQSLFDPARPAGSEAPAGSGGGSLGRGSLGPGSLGPDSLGPGSVGPGSVGPGSVGPGSLGPGSVGQAAGQPRPRVSQPGGRHRLLPADLTVSTAPSRADCARARWRALDHTGQLDARIAEPRLRHCATIAVVSPKGGVGKTTVTALLGTLFSLLRRDPTVAVDTNPDFGSLGRVLTPDQSWYVDDLARLVAEDDELSLTALDSQLGRAIHGLLVVPAPTDPARMAALDEDAYRRVIGRLKDFFSLILLDCGTGLQDPASAAAIAAADQVVLLTDAQPATASLVAHSAELLQQSGRPITVVVNRMPPKGARLDLDRLSRYLPAARGLVVIPDQVQAATRLAGGGFDWRDAPSGWQLAVRQLAVVLVADWRRLGLAQ
jgi:MinD-like ATPase involved in chromosome partitioning or flagellar assembly